MLIYKSRKKRQYNTYLKAETYQKNFANFCNVVSQNLATMTAKFDKNFRNFLWGVAKVTVIWMVASDNIIVTSELALFTAICSFRSGGQNPNSME